MKAIIIYASKSGNTKKIADSMASQIGCTTIRIDKNNLTSTVELNNFDFFFIGTGIYAGTPNEDIVKYLNTLNLKTPKKFVLFISWGGAPRTDKIALGKLKSIIEGKGHKVLSEHFSAFGGWKGILMKRGHPKPDEITAAGVWAKNILDKMENITE